MGQVYLMRLGVYSHSKKVSYTRNPNVKFRNTSEIRMFQFGHLNVFRISIFDFRISATSRENGR